MAQAKPLKAIALRNKKQIIALHQQRQHGRYATAGNSSSNSSSNNSIYEFAFKNKRIKADLMKSLPSSACLVCFACLVSLAAFSCLLSCREVGGRVNALVGIHRIEWKAVAVEIIMQ